MTRLPRPPKTAPSVRERAAALLQAHAKTAVCRVGASEHCAVIEAMHAQGGKAPLIGRIARDELGLKVANDTIAKHLAHKCVCWAGNAYHGQPPSRTA